jgi:hypothetical protein
MEGPRAQQEGQNENAGRKNGSSFHAFSFMDRMPVAKREHLGFARDQLFHFKECIGIPNPMGSRCHGPWIPQENRGKGVFLWGMDEKSIRKLKLSVKGYF